MTLLQSPHIGPLFETLVYADFIKRNANQGEIPDHFYLQTKSKIGVDFLVQKNRKFDLFEIKFSQTFQSRLTQQLLLTNKALKHVNSLNLILPTKSDFETKIEGFDILVKNWSRMSWHQKQKSPQQRHKPSHKTQKERNSPSTYAQIVRHFAHTYQRFWKISKSQSFFLFGQRGSGKSTLVNTLFKPNEALQINPLDQKQEFELSTNPDSLQIL
jgi:predicted AAA+ superfamily ATPase